MENEDSKQNTDLAVVNNKLENIAEKIASGFNRSEGMFKMFEEKNCRKHQEILATVNNYQGKMEERVKGLCDRVESVEKEQIRTDAKIKNILVYFSVIGTAIIIAIDIVRKRFGI